MRPNIEYQELQVSARPSFVWVWVFFMLDFPLETEGPRWRLRRRRVQVLQRDVHLFRADSYTTDL